VTGRPTRRWLRVAMTAGVVVALLVLFLLWNPLSPRPSPSPGPTSPPSQALDATTPEGAVRLFLAAFAEARRSDNPTLIRPFVTSDQSSAYQSVQGFLLGQKASKKGSVLTVQQLENLVVDSAGSTATVRFRYTEGGYDISLSDGHALESPTVLPPRDVTIDVREVDGRWLVDTYQARAQ
jgi:hypothetical protein